MQWASSCRDDVTRTRDPYVPNVVRYQLRYIPLLKSATKLQLFPKIANQMLQLFRKSGQKGGVKW